MDTSTLSAINAYKDQLRLAREGSPAALQDDANSSAFLDMVREAAGDAINTQRQAEALQMDSLTGGTVDITDLVTAVSSAELTVSTVVAVRDRVINAYQEIIRMPL